MLQSGYTLQRTSGEKVKPTIEYNKAFVASRRQIESTDRIQLSSDLLTAGWSNYNAINEGQKGSRYHFHVINGHYVYVTIIITADNRLTLRGTEYQTITQLFSHIDDYKV